MNGLLEVQMKVFLIPFIFVFFSGYSLANTLTYKSPIYEFKRSSSCSTAMNGAKRKAEKSCRGAKVKSVSCVGCGMKKRFNTKTYVCTAKVKYSCSRGSSTSSRKKDTYTNKKIRQLRGKARTYKSKKRRKEEKQFVI